MVLQENVSQIVTLASIIEEGKVKMHKYWTDSSANFGGIDVTLQSQHNASDYTVRTFLVENKKTHKSQEVKRFHFTQWPDNDIPGMDSFIEFLKEIRSNSHTMAPTVVHCSAGIGRTGTFILADSVWQKALNTKEVEFLQRLYNMRDQRYRLVETEGQYLFAHEAVAVLLRDSFYF
nr:protein tyrosine phosphatase receptor type t-like protein [Physocyclus mexicanus]